MKAAVYARLSRVADDADNLPEQRARGYAVAERHRWTVVGDWTDDGKSAWRKTVRRPAFEDLLAACERGAVDVIIVRKLNRLTRNPRDWGRLRASGVKFVEWGGSGDIMPNLVADIMASMAESETEELSERVKLSEARRVQPLDGSPAAPPRGGTRHWGYTADHRVIPEEAEVIQECAQRWLDGEPMLALVEDLARRGVRTPTGSTWANTSLKRALLSPRLASIRRHNGREHRGNWEPILTVETHEALRNAVGRSKLQRPHRRWLLRNLIKCSRCGNVRRREPSALNGRTHSYGPRYRCAGCDLTIVAEPVDALVFDAALGRHRRRQFASASDAEAELIRAERAVTEARDRLERLNHAHWVEGALSAEEYHVHAPALRERIATLEADATRLRTARTETANVWRSLAKMVETAESATWDDRRRIIESVVERVEIEPAGHRSPHFPFDEDEIEEGSVVLPEHDRRLDLRRVGIVWRA
jgi:DNA invertase Pin-like site-specific DNA recombinase